MGDDREEFMSNIKTTYVEAFYFITTTMTQVGYGDVTVFGFGPATMVTIIIIEFGGILGFSIIKEQIFTAKKEQKVDFIIKRSQKEVETIMFRLDRVRKEKLPDHMYDASIEYMRTVIRFSIKESFADISFWRELHPQL